MNLTKRISLPRMAIGLVGIALALILVFGVALAQTETTAQTTIATDIPQELVSLAQDLGCQTSAQCALKFDANIEQGIILAQKYDIYTPEQEKLATSFRTEVLERLRAVSQDNFEQEILVLANKILSEKPALAKTMGVTQQTVSAAETVINTLKDAGTDIRTCQKSPEDLSREQLIACIKASNDLSSKEKVVGDYIPKENTKAKEAERMLDLENSLLAGEYSGLGKIGVEQAGQICLKPGSESIADCDRIAQRFFGNEGVKHLQEARQQTTRIKEYYTQGIEKMELVTPDGQKLIGKGAIRNACDKAFENSNLGLARACGNFAVKNGYATQAEIEDGLKLLESFSQKAEGVNFDDCRFNPESCREFLPDEFRSQFDSQFEIFKIMSESIGFDPARCENSYDPDIGKRCLEGAKAALGRVEEIAKNSPEARRIVDEIRSHINEGERMTERRDKFHEESRAGGNAGPGGCRGPEECFKYCSQGANSAECISFGAKSQIFDQSSVIQRFNTVNERFNTPYPDPRFNQYPPYPQQPNMDPGLNRYPYPQQPVGPSPECFAAISSGDFAKAKIICSSTTENYPKPIAEPFPVCPAYSMPSPCPEGQMRQMASDSRNCPTYGACTAIEGYRPIDIPKPCPSGQYWNGTACVSSTTSDIWSNKIWTFKDGTTKSSSILSRTDSEYTAFISGIESDCRAKYFAGWKSGAGDQTNWQGFGVPECSTTATATTTATSCPSGQYWNGLACTASPTPQCSSNQWWDSVTQSCKSSPIPTVGSCNYSTEYWKASTSECQYRSNCYNTANSEYNSQECQGVRGSITPVASGCGSFATQATCQAIPGCGWANGACGGNMTTSGTCPSGQYWYYPPGGGAGYCMSSTAGGTCPIGYHSHSESGGFCMNDQENYSGTCYNSAGTSTITCPQMTYTSSCPSGQYWYYPPAGGAGYCMSSTTCSSGQYWNGSACVTNPTTYSTDPATGCAQAGGTWNTSTNYCQMSTTTSPSASCSSGQYWNGTACVATSTTDCPSGQYWNGSSCVSSTTPSTSCPSDQYWNGSACVSNSPTPTPEPTPTPTDPTPSSDPATMCAQSGGTWTGSACQMAKNISDQKDYYSYYQKQSSSLLGQIFAAAADLFR